MNALLAQPGTTQQLVRQDVLHALLDTTHHKEPLAVPPALVERSALSLRLQALLFVKIVKQAFTRKLGIRTACSVLVVHIPDLLHPSVQIVQQVIFHIQDQHRVSSAVQDFSQMMAQMVVPLVKLGLIPLYQDLHTALIAPQEPKAHQTLPIVRYAQLEPLVWQFHQIAQYVMLVHMLHLVPPNASYA